MRNNRQVFDKVICILVIEKNNIYFLLISRYLVYLMFMFEINQYDLVINIFVDNEKNLVFLFRV